MTDAPPITDMGDHYLLRTSSAPLSRCLIDYYLSMEFGEAHFLSVMTGSPIEARSEGRLAIAEPEQPASLAPILALLRRPLLLARVYKSGDLELLFADDVMLTIRSDPHYEAWELGMEGVGKFIALPGGGLAEWDRNR